jgi:Zinc finger, C3HC4 type (RING finger)
VEAMTQQIHGDEGRFKVAAATAAVVPFHCVVCFDEFSLKERPPVVLPCGHTYICAPCSKRLKRCMECREPLFITVKHSNQQQGSYNAPRTPILPAPTMYGRYSPTPSTPPQGTSSSSFINTNSSQQYVQQIPLALPKNVVLICMMEAAERQMRDSNNINTEAVLELIDDTNGSMNASDEDEEYDLNRIISGMATFSGPCGTYAVKERDGLSILNEYPNNNDDDVDDDNEDDSRNDDVTRTALHVTASCDSIEVSNPCTLKHGQTVQVVRFENGIATLARESGYIKATSSQLVKGK